MLKFEHLHTHSHYSLLDGLSGIRPMVERALEHGQETVAVTDHGSIAAVPELFRTAKEYGLKAIAGMEAYQTHDASDKTKDSGTYHLTILASDLIGYQNLCKLVTKSYRDGFYGKPRLDWGMLNQHKQGLIVLSGCINGQIAQTLLGDDEYKGDPVAAERLANEIADMIGYDNFYLEFMDHGMKEQKVQNNAQLLWMKRNPKLRGVVTQDSHYMFEEDANVHQTLLCIGSRSTVQSPKFTFSGGPYHYCDADGLSRKFDRKLILATREIAEKCKSYDIPKTGKMPDLSPSTLGGKRPFEYLRELAEAGLKKRNKHRKGTYWMQLRHELGVVNKLGWSSYFIMVAEILGWARGQRILVGPGRGSSAGSLLAYCLQITDIDPMVYQLYFERFLNETRVSPPDIDVDIADSGRQQVLQHVREKYGEEKVAHIGSFSAMGPRQSIRDVAIANGMAFEKVNAALSDLDDNPMLKFEDVERMSAVTNNFPKKIIDQARVMNGKYRHMSTHAAGIIIANHKLDQHLPMITNREGALQTLYDMDEVANLGYIKFDILGLKTLGVISDVVKNAHIWAKDLKAMYEFNDDKVYDLICSGRTMGVFQLEGYGYIKMIKRYKPRNFEDIMMINALYRPGPMQGGEGLETILRRRNGEEPTTYKHPDLEPILYHTYGMPVFQEQVMRMCQVLAGFTLVEADNMRSAIGKKDEVKLAAQRTAFIRGCVGKGHSRDFAEEIFTDIEFFNRYGWNRAHAAAYGAVTYYTAWLKTHFPHQFMAELINRESDAKRLYRLQGECRGMGIEFEAVDINKSQKFYTVHEYMGNKSLRPGFANVRGVGEKAADAIVAARGTGRFDSITEARERIPRKSCNKTMWAALERDGAFRDLPEVAEKEEVPF